MNPKSELLLLLGRLDRQEDVARSRRRAVTLLAELGLDEVADLLEDLSRTGVVVPRAASLCPTHLHLARHERRSFRRTLPDGHVLATLMDEHLHILTALDRLAALVDRDQRPEREELEEILRVCTFLVEIEPHHQREERVLFPAMRERGIEGPTAIMDREHVIMRRRQLGLRDLVRGLLDGRELSWSFVRETGVELASGLREHVFREDNILFPMAAGAIRPVAAWDALRERCDDVGYACGHDHRAP